MTDRLAQPASVSTPSHDADPDAGCRLRIVVLGQPEPQGSAKAVPVGGHAKITHSGGVAFARWRNDVHTAARRAATDAGQIEPLTGPLRMTIDFRRAMPTSRPKYLRDQRIAWRPNTPDLDKLVRTIGDALTAAAVIGDDRMIVELRCRDLEVWQLWTGADVLIEQIRRLP